MSPWTLHSFKRKYMRFMNNLRPQIAKYSINCAFMCCFHFIIGSLSFWKYVNYSQFNPQLEFTICIYCSNRSLCILCCVSLTVTDQVRRWISIYYLQYIMCTLPLQWNFETWVRKTDSRAVSMRRPAPANLGESRFIWAADASAAKGRKPFHSSRW